MGFSADKLDGVSSVVLGLGSNRGDSPALLDKAAAALEKVLTGLRRASLITSDPLHVTDQPRFFNTAVSGFYSGSPRDLLDCLHSIEAAFGRDRQKERRWGERTLDIDILLFGNRVVSDPPALEIPHPRLGERRFALVPLLELLPDAADPRTGLPYKEIMDKLPPQGIYSPA
jgi:2-amino-4-hydroxy-6-hydroxymethyldihydropteridine diphosphokinase